MLEKYINISEKSKEEVSLNKEKKIVYKKMDSNSEKCKNDILKLENQTEISLTLKERSKIKDIINLCNENQINEIIILKFSSHKQDDDKYNNTNENNYKNFQLMNNNEIISKNNIIKNNLINSIKMHNKTIYLIIILSLVTINISFENLIIYYGFSNITLKIRGPGKQSIFYGNECEINSVKTNIIRPNEVYIDEIKQPDANNEYNFEEKTYFIKLVWNNVINNCDCLFKGCSKILEIDFSNFNFSQGLSANQMFSNCSSLTSINFNYIGTIQIINAGSMFSFCTSLSSLNLSNFDTSTVTDMSKMFQGCHSLISLNLINFRTNQVTNGEYLFYDCPNLIYVNFKNAHFCSSGQKTNSFLLASENIIFCSGCSAITPQISGCAKVNCEDNWKTIQNKINLENNTCVSDCSFTPNNKYNYNSKCYTECPNRTFINNFTCEDCHPDCETCEKPADINSTNCNSCLSPDKFLLSGNCVSKCYLEKCFKCSQESLSKDLCISCNEEYYPKYEEIVNNENYPFIDCYQSPEGYYLDEEKFYKPCYNSCKSCNISGNDTHHNCFECNSNYNFIFDLKTYKNCYKNCKFYYYFNKISKTNYCTETPYCPDNYEKFINDKKECINECYYDDIYKYEFRGRCYIECPEGSKKREKFSDTKEYLCEAICSEEKPFEIVSTQECVKICPIKDLIDELCLLNYKMKNEGGKLEDLFLNNIEKDLTSVDYNTSNLENGGEDIIEFGQMTVTLTTTRNQKSNKNKNVSLIDIKECEISLRKEYNITDKVLFIKKIDIREEGMKIPKIEYDIYCKLNDINLIKLNISVCENNEVDISIHVKIFDNLDKLDSNSGYYNNICYITSSSNGTDISLKDRKNEFIEGNKTICQEGCVLSKYDYSTENAICSCKPKSSSSHFIDMKINKTELLNNFIDVNNIVNIKLLKCYKELFSKDGILYNIAFYIIIPIIIFHFLTIFIFFKYQKIILDEKIDDITYGIKNWDLVEEYEKRKKVDENKINIAKNNKKDTIIRQNNITGIGDTDINRSPKKKKLVLRRHLQMMQLKQNIINKENNEISNRKILIDNETQDIIGKSKEIMNYTDEELNNLPHNIAINYDTRTFREYYFSLLKTKHNLIFSFYYDKDYNSKIVKIDLFFISFVIYYTVNALFFNDNTMHKIYIDEGSFNFIYQLPQIIYSSLISSVLNLLLKLFALSEQNILGFKRNKTKENLDKRLKDLYSKLNKKFIHYFVVSFIFLIFFWYYLSAFGAIYRNTQYHLIKDTIICFGLSMIYPFGIYLIPGIFRIPALSDPKNKRIYLYKISILFQMI